MLLLLLILSEPQYQQVPLQNTPRVDSNEDKYSVYDSLLRNDDDNSPLYIKKSQFDDLFP